MTAARARAIARVGQGLPNASVGWLAEVGADEALKPIRELHKSAVSETHHDHWLDCDECGQDWPCNTARHAYAESELAQ